MKNYDPQPTIKGFINEYNSQITIWCPECKTWHTHGEGNGNRASHCLMQESKYNTNLGYRIESYTKADLLKFKQGILKLILTDKEKEMLNFNEGGFE